MLSSFFTSVFFGRLGELEAELPCEAAVVESVDVVAVVFLFDFGG